MLAIGIKQVDGQGSANTDHQHRPLRLGGGKQGQETVDTEFFRLGVGNAYACTLGAGAHHMHVLEAALQLIQHGAGQRRRGNAGDKRGFTTGQAVRRLSGHAFGAMRPGLYVAGAVAMQGGKLETRIAQVEQPVAHAFLTLTSPACSRRSRPSMSTRSAPSSARPSAVPCCHWPSSCTRTSRPASMSNAA
ncbi:hypothetical protein D3C73_1055430 [compost metagenome]